MLSVGTGYLTVGLWLVFAWIPVTVFSRSCGKLRGWRRTALAGVTSVAIGSSAVLAVRSVLGGRADVLEPLFALASMTAVYWLMHRDMDRNVAWIYLVLSGGAGLAAGRLGSDTLSRAMPIGAEELRVWKYSETGIETVAVTAKLDNNAFSGVVETLGLTPVGRRAYPHPNPVGPDWWTLAWETPKFSRRDDSNCVWWAGYDKGRGYFSRECVGY